MIQSFTTRLKQKASVRSGVLAIFLVILAIYLPVLLRAAHAADDRLHGTVRTNAGDDGRFQWLAVNLLYGKGYADGIILPLETYHFDLSTRLGVSLKQKYETEGPDTPQYTFYIAPGWPLQLSLAYRLFGNNTLVARTMLAVMVWLAALLILFTGDTMAGWRGALAGGGAGLLFLNFYVLFRPRESFMESLMSEGSATFWISLFAFLFVVYLRTRRIRFLAIAALILAWSIYIRPYFAVAVPFLLVYLYLQSRDLWRPALFATLILLPVLIWSTYASATLGKLVGFTVEGEDAFPQCNNEGVLEGVGPGHLYQGQWNPGWELDGEGNLIDTGRYKPQPGQNGWLLGLTYWKDNITQLPKLFFVKLRAGFWYSERTTIADSMRVRLYSLCLGFVFLAVGLRTSRSRSPLLPRLAAKHVLAIQLGLVFILFLIGNSASYLIVLALFLLILVLALLHPYGDAYVPDFISPNWFLCFVLEHVIITMAFIGIRYHQPLDPILFLFGLLGGIIVFDELVLKRLAERKISLTHPRSSP